MGKRSVIALVATVAAGLIGGCKQQGESTGIVGEGDAPMIGTHFRHAAIASGETSIGDTLAHGRMLFAANFNSLDGAGRPESTGTSGSRPPRTAPENANRISGPDANSCMGCHGVPRIGGGGDNVANVFVLAQAFPHVNFDGGPGDNFQTLTLDSVGNERTTLGMFGSGYVELLAREMTVDLHAIRDAARATAIRNSAPATRQLITKGVSFGRITAHPGGNLDTSAVEGIDADLIVKPFHQKGVVVSLREFTNNAMNHHHGMQSGERFGVGIDADNDGHVDEATAGDITALTLFQATLAAPGRVLPQDAGAAAAVARGEALFARSIVNGGIACNDCHRNDLMLQDPVYTEPNPFNPAGNLRPADVAAPIRIDLTQVGEQPRLPRETSGAVRVPLYSDLKRHDMGPGLAEANVQAGVPTTHFLTKKLWGFANEPPYMHHGRATTIAEAILMHGGEAQASRDAFAALSATDQAAVTEFLKSLQVLPDGTTTTQITAPFSGVIGDAPTVLTHLDQQDIDAGRIPIASLAATGAQIFGASFNTLDGAGRPESTGTGLPRDRRVAPENFNRVSGPDANSCKGCHNQPRIGGGGENVANVFVLAQAFPHVNFDQGAGDDFLNLALDSVGNERNTLGMWGSGYIELLAREMTADLHAIRDAALTQARAERRNVTVPLDTKDVNFGTLTARPDGTLFAGDVEGVDADLIVKPFHQKGVVVSLREFTNNAMNHHHGIQTRERFGPGLDADKDGHVDELTEGDVTAVTVFQALMAVPGIVPARDSADAAARSEGARVFDSVGCAQCHRPHLVLRSPVFTEPNPYNPPGNLLPQHVSRPLSIDLTTNGDAPRLPREPDGSVLVPAFTDLKRHDMGPRMAEARVQAGVPTSEFITRKLWGFASEPPFMHHGRATTIREAIDMHGGDAQEVRDAFFRLSPNVQNCVIDYLKSMQILPERP